MYVACMTKYKACEVSLEKRSVKCLPQDINCTNVKKQLPAQSLSCHMRRLISLDEPNSAKSSNIKYCMEI